MTKTKVCFLSRCSLLINSALMLGDGQGRATAPVEPAPMDTCNGSAPNAGMPSTGITGGEPNVTSSGGSADERNEEVLVLRQELDASQQRAAQAEETAERYVCVIQDLRHENAELRNRVAMLEQHIHVLEEQAMRPTDVLEQALVNLHQEHGDTMTTEQERAGHHELVSETTVDGESSEGERATDLSGSCPFTSTADDDNPTVAASIESDDQSLEVSTRESAAGPSTHQEDPGEAWAAIMSQDEQTTAAWLSEEKQDQQTAATDDEQCRMPFGWQNKIVREVCGHNNTCWS